jgi:hypothetical protein
MAGSVILRRTGDIGDDHRPTAQPGLISAESDNIGNPIDRTSPKSVNYGL